MIIMWTAIAALSCAWLAGDAVLGLVVAPRLFVLAGEQGIDKAFAGLVFGDVLSRWVVFAGIFCVIPIAVMLAAAAGRSLKLQGWKPAVPALLAMIVVLSAHAMTATTVDFGRRTAQELREHPDAARMERFRGEFHARSRLVISLEMLSALGLAIGAAIMARNSARGASIGSPIRRGT